MTDNYENFATEAQDTTIAVGGQQCDLSQAKHRLEAGAAQIGQLTGLAEIWQITEESNKVLRILFPDYSDIFEGVDPRTPSSGDAIPADVCIKVLIRQVLSGIQTLHMQEIAKQGAEIILNDFPSPIPKSATPFADTKGIWNHTHGAEDEP